MACLKVCANGWADGENLNSHVEVPLCMMRGEYDEIMLNKLEVAISKKYHNSTSPSDIGCHCHRRLDVLDRVTLSPNGYSFDQFIHHIT